MKRKQVTSSNLKSVGYDEEKEILEIEFKNNSIYQYSGIPKNIYETLMAASSHGKCFHRLIREKYPTKRTQ